MSGLSSWHGDGALALLTVRANRIGRPCSVSSVELLRPQSCRFEQDNLTTHPPPLHIISRRTLHFQDQSCRSSYLCTKSALYLLVFDRSKLHYLLVTRLPIYYS
jgi:hypothetical protein